ncbi:MAG TPA: septum site-determining protein MinC [Nevskiaceae bacterium]
MPRNSPAISCMSADASSSTQDALAFSGRMLSVTRVRVLRADKAAIGSQLALWAGRMAQALHGMPVVVDSDVPADLAGLVHQLRAVGMLPIGVSEGPLAKSAATCGLPVLAPEREHGKKSRTPPGPAPAVAAPPPPPPPAARAGRKPAHLPARIVVEPVRSGQQIHAQNADLVVLNHVSAGAELIADGCIHVYGRLSGRAIAGASGDDTARIFCSRLEAELVAIAGIYAVAEQIKDGPRGAAAMAWLEDERLRIEPLA